MLTKTRVKNRNRVLDTRQNELCEGECMSCSLIMYHNCKNPKKINRNLTILEEEIKVTEFQEELQMLEHLISYQGFIGIE